MKIVRNSPTALNKPELILGVPPNVLIGCVAGYAACMILPINKLLLAAFFVLVAVACKMLVATDPKLPIVFFRALCQKAIYEPNRRKVFRLEIK